MTRTINHFLRSEAAILTLLAMALISQTPHTAVLFHRLSPSVEGAANFATWLHAAAYAIALEFATLVFVVRGQRALSWLFALVSIAVNMLYYAIGDLSALYVASALLVSVALPVSIAFYSHNVARESEGTEGAQAEGTEDAQPTPEPSDAIEPDTPPAQPDPAQIIHAQTVTEKQAKKHTKAKAHRRKPVTGMTPAQRRAQIVELELTDAKDVQKQFGGSLRRAQMDLAAVKGEGQ